MMSHTGSITHPLRALQPEVDYQALMASLQTQSHPRRKLQEFEKKGYLIRLKKGFYVLTKEFIGRDYSSQIVANLLYGPSYLSLEYALAHYGLIPERVEAFTSVTSQKIKSFETPIGLYTYRHLTPALYPLGVTLKKNVDERSYLIASPEKALMDIFTLKFENSSAPTASDIEPALHEDLRLNVDEFKKNMNRELLEEMQPHYKHRAWNRLLFQFLLEKV